MTYVSPDGSTVDEPELLSRTALKAQRLKPAPGQEPAKRVWSHTRLAYTELFDPRLCVAMRERRAPSPAQLAALDAGRRARTHANCADCGESVELYLLDQQQACLGCAGMRWEAAQRARESARISALQALSSNRHAARHGPTPRRSMASAPPTWPVRRTWSSWSPSCRRSSRRLIPW